MKPRLLNWIVCPQCGGDLQLVNPKQEGEEVVSGALSCPREGKLYPIVNGIPRLLPGATFASMAKNYAESFGYEWNRFHWLRPEDDEREFYHITDLSPADFHGKVTVEVGCGGGRIMRFLAPHCQELIGFDFSLAVEKAAELCRQYPNAHIIQADALFPPIRPLSADIVYSHGVLHHTPDTWIGFQRAAALVRPGGMFYLCVFRKTLAAMRFLDNVLRQGLNKLPHSVLAKVCWAMTFLADVPGLRRLHRFVWFSRERDRRVRQFCNFDWYAPQYHHEHSIEEVKGWFRAADFENVKYINGWPKAEGDFKYRALTTSELAWHAGLVGVIGRRKAAVELTAAEIDALLDRPPVLN